MRKIPDKATQDIVIQTLQTIADSQGLSFRNQNFKFKKGKATPIKAETPAVGEMLALKKRDAKGIEKQEAPSVTR